MTAGSTSVWLPRVLFESALITVSILLALGLDEWREDRQNLQTIEQAMSNFLSEIRQNKARVDDAAPFNQGLRDVLLARYEAGSIATSADFIGIVESYAPVVLQATAWETALATGSVTKMDYNLVSALSLTYGLQDRYQEATANSAVESLIPYNIAADTLDVSVYNAVRYLSSVTAMETELGVVYEEAETVIRNAWMDMRSATEEEFRVWAGTY